MKPQPAQLQFTNFDIVFVSCITVLRTWLSPDNINSQRVCFSVVTRSIPTGLHIDRFYCFSLLFCQVSRNAATAAEISREGIFCSDITYAYMPCGLLHCQHWIKLYRAAQDEYDGKTASRCMSSFHQVHKTFVIKNKSQTPSTLLLCLT